MSQEKEREAFEAWCRQEFGEPELWIPGQPQCGYANARVQDYWTGFRAAWSAALASQQAVKGEPIGWASDDGRVVSAELVKRYPEHKHTYHIPLYLASPPSREPLTEEQIAELYVEWSNTDRASFADLMRSVERAHGIHSREGGSNG